MAKRYNSRQTLNKEHILHLAVDGSTNHLVREQAKAEDIPVSQLLRKAVNLYLSQKSKEQAA